MLPHPHPCQAQWNRHLPTVERGLQHRIEEAYSLAMLVQQVLPDWMTGTSSMLATDINPQFA